MKWFWALWYRRGDRDEIARAEKRLENVIRDDEKVERLERRADKIMRDNNLAPYIMRALGAKGN